MPSRFATGPVLALALVALPAAAQGVLVDATAIGDNTSTIQRVGLDHALVWTVTEYEPVQATDGASPFSGLAGPCFGQIEIRGTNASGGGYCTWTDGDGDTLTTRWTATAVDADEASAGEWAAFEGTGKWEGATGGGSYAVHEDLETGRRVNRISGELTLR